MNGMRGVCCCTSTASATVVVCPEGVICFVNGVRGASCGSALCVCMSKMRLCFRAV